MALRIQLLSGVAFLSVLGATSAQAQATAPAPQAAASPDPAANEPMGLAEIVVTAQRVSENSQRAAVAINVVTGGDLVRAGAGSVDHLTSLIPALTVPSSGSYNYYFVRGVGNFASTSYSDPAVAFNYDGVYVGRPTSAAGVFYDLERVEVLKGPQGTLYGRNATGGAINVLPARPKLGEASGSLSGSYGNYDAFSLQGAVNAPIGENGAFRIAANIVDRGAYLQDGQADEKVKAVRAQVKFELPSSLTVRVSADYAHVGGAGAGFSYVDGYRYDPTLTTRQLGERFLVTPVGLSLSEGIFSPASQAYLQTRRAGPAGRNLNALSRKTYQDNDFYGLNAEINYDTSIGTLTIIPAWRYATLDNLGGFLASVLNDETDEQYSIEARLGKTGVGIFDYNVGVYYFDETIDGRIAVNQQALAVQQAYKTGTESYAAFGRLTAHLSDRFRVVGGVRYTHDNKVFDGQSNRVTLVCLSASCPTLPLFPPYRTFADIPFALPAFGVPAGPGPVPGSIISRGDVVVDANQKIGKVTYRGAVEYDLGPRSLVFASVETGYRSGGFSLAAGYETYDPEFITAYTIGSKNRFLDNRVQLNVEAFSWKYRNQQVSHVGIDRAGQQGNFTENVGESSLKGFEVEGRFLATRTTLLSADVQYLDSSYKTFSYQAPLGTAPPYTTCKVTPATNPAFYDVDCSGKPAYNSAKWTINFAAQQTFELGAHKIVVGADTQHRSSQAIGFEYRPSQIAPANWRTNAMISYGDIEDRWDISAFVRNIEGDRTPTFASNVSIGSVDISIPSAPRTYGVRLSAKF